MHTITSKVRGCKVYKWLCIGFSYSFIYLKLFLSLNILYWVMKIPTFNVRLQTCYVFSRSSTQWIRFPIISFPNNSIFQLFHMQRVPFSSYFVSSLFYFPVVSYSVCSVPWISWWSKWRSLTSVVEMSESFPNNKTIFQL